jgi:hypothetical protein
MTTAAATLAPFTPSAKPTRKPARRTARKPKAEQPARVGIPAVAYIALAGLASCALNGLANSVSAPTGYALPAWGLGIFVPVAVLLLGRTAGLLYRAKHRRLAYAVGTIAAVVLGLSVVHCSHSIALLTGSHWTLAAALAVGIDAGMVASEIAHTLTAQSGE